MASFIHTRHVEAKYREVGTGLGRSDSAWSAQQPSRQGWRHGMAPLRVTCENTPQAGPPPPQSHTGRHGLLPLYHASHRGVLTWPHLSRAEGQRCVCLCPSPSGPSFWGGAPAPLEPASMPQRINPPTRSWSRIRRLRKGRRFPAWFTTSAASVQAVAVALLTGTCHLVSVRVEVVKLRTPRTAVGPPWGAHPS